MPGFFKCALVQMTGLAFGHAWSGLAGPGWERGCRQKVFEEGGLVVPATALVIAPHHGGGLPRVEPALDR